MDDADLLRNRAPRLFCASHAKPPRRLFRVRGRTGQFGASGREARGNNRKALPVAWLALKREGNVSYYSFSRLQLVSRNVLVARVAHQ